MSEATEKRDNDLIIYNPRQLNDDGIKGDLFEGTFVETIEAERKTKDGRPFVSRSHKFLNEDGKTILLNSSGLFDYLMRKNSVVAGSKCKVMYYGKDDKGFHSFDLAVR